MNRILSVTLCLFFIYLYIYKTYGKVKNTDEGLSNIYGAKYYLRSGLFNEKNGKGQKYEDLEEEKEGENDDEEDSNSEESNNDEENELIKGQEGVEQETHGSEDEVSNGREDKVSNGGEDEVSNGREDKVSNGREDEVSNGREDKGGAGTDGELSHNSESHTKNKKSKNSIINMLIGM